MTSMSMVSVTSYQTVIHLMTREIQDFRKGVRGGG